MNEAEPTAEGHAAAELTALRAASPLQPPGGAGAADAPPTAQPKPPTAMQVESALKDKLQLLRDQADALLKHTANTPQYLVDVVRRHSANPAIGGGRGKILTMLRCHCRAQVTLETNIAAISSNLDEDKKAEFGGFIKTLKARAPTPPQPEAKVQDDTSIYLDKLIDKLPSAATGADIKCTDGLEAVMLAIEEFVLRAVAVVRKHGAGLQKKSNPRAYDYRATAAFHLFSTDLLLVEVPYLSLIHI